MACTPAACAPSRENEVRAAVVASICATALTSAAQAEEASIAVRGCGWLEVAELTRHVRLELMTVPEPLRAVAIDFACGGDDLTIGIANRDRGIRVERRVADACCEDVELERTVAALTVGLLRAAAPVLAGEPVSAPTPSEAIPYEVVPMPSSTGSASASGAPVAGGSSTLGAPPSDAVASPSPGAAAPPPSPPMSFDAWGHPTTNVTTGPWLAPTPDREEPPRPRHEIGVGGRVALHSVSDPIAMLGPKLRYRGWALSWLALGGQASASFGKAQREGGAVEARLFQIDAEMALRLAGSSDWSLLASGSGGLAIVQLAGEPHSDDLSAAEATGATGEIGLSVIPGFGAGSFGASLPLELGYVFRAPRGLVSGQPSVQIDGMWVGASLIVHAGLGAIDEPIVAGAMP
jgi:hypothetical protein